jgi:hypothetical protein
VKSQHSLGDPTQSRRRNRCALCIASSQPVPRFVLRGLSSSFEASPESTAVDVGAELARARETRSLSLNDLSRRTKIGVASLIAIEQGDLRQLPGGVFTRGFIRAYAREVGCDPEAIVERFLAEYGDRPAGAMPVSRRPNTDEPGCKSGQVHVAEIDLRDKRQSQGAWARFAVLVAVVGVAYLGYTANIRTRAGRVPGADITPAAVDASTATALEVGTTGLRDRQGDINLQPAAPADALRLDIEPDGLCWLAAIADGRQVVYRLLAPGERTRIDARDAVVLRVGDAGRFRFAVNGQTGRTLGNTGQALTIAITPENFRDFLAR